MPNASSPAFKCRFGRTAYSYVTRSDHGWEVVPLPHFLAALPANINEGGDKQKDSALVYSRVNAQLCFNFQTKIHRQSGNADSRPSMGTNFLAKNV